MKSKKIKILIIAFLLVVSVFSGDLYANNQDKDITYTIDEILSEDGLSSTLTLTLQTSSKVKEIVKVDTPDGRSIEKQNTITQVVTENKDYSFTVYYTYLQENIEKQEVITYQETKIQPVPAVAGSIQPTVPSTDDLLSRSVLTANTPSVYATGDIAINEENFPDAKFRKYLLDNTDFSYGEDGVFTVAELSDITRVSVSQKYISNLKGIEYFTALTQLICSDNQLTSLDVSANTALTQLICSDNQLTSLDVSANTALTGLYCHSNPLTSLNISGLTKLTYFAYMNAGYTIASTLTTLKCNNADLSLINLSEFTKLTTLECSNTGLTNLDVSIYPELTNLVCSDNQLISLNVITNPALTELDVSFNQLTNLSVSTNRNLEVLSLDNNRLTSLNLNSNTALRELNITNNKLTSLDVSANTALTSLNCADNTIGMLSLTRNTNLVFLNCTNNAIAQLDVSKNLLLDTLYCADNAITQLDVSKHTALLDLDAGNNAISNFVGRSGLSSCNLVGQQVQVGVNQDGSTANWSSVTSFNSNVVFDNTDISYNRTQKKIFVFKPTEMVESGFLCANADGGTLNSELSGTVTFTASQYFVPVTNLGYHRLSQFAGTSSPLQATVIPDTASLLEINWSIIDAGTTGATLEGDVLTVKTPGNLVVEAVIYDGTVDGDYAKEINMTVDYANSSSLVCTYSGTINPGAKANWYSGDVTVTPPSGYQISTTLASGYTSQVVVTQSQPTVYLKEISSGKLYNQKVLYDVNIDRVAPTITGIDNNGSAIGASDIYAMVNDDNLDSVLLFSADNALSLVGATGVPVSFSGTSCQVTLGVLNKDQYYKIEAIDKAGRKTMYVYTVLAATYEMSVSDVVFDDVSYDYSQPTAKPLVITNTGNTPPLLVV